MNAKLGRDIAVAAAETAQLRLENERKLDPETLRTTLTDILLRHFPQRVAPTAAVDDIVAAIEEQLRAPTKQP